MGKRTTTYLLAVLVLLSAVFLSARAEEQAPPGQGAVSVVTRKVAVSGFEKVSVEMPGELVVTQGSLDGRDALTIEAEDTVQPLIQAKVEDGVLRIFQKSGTTLQTSQQIRFHVWMKRISGISASSASQVLSEGIRSPELSLVSKDAGTFRITGLDVDKLAVRSEGAASMLLAGKAGDQDVRLSGAGNYMAQELATLETRIRLSGSGGAAVRVAETLDVKLTGAGNVTYYGNPKTVRPNDTGSGMLIKGN